MKKMICLLLSLTFLLCACGAPDGQDTVPATTETTTAPTTTPTTVPADPTEPPTTAPDGLEDLRNNLPTMDGSTSLIPLEAGIRAALFGKTIEEATLEVSHSTTWDSFWSLLGGSVDLIFSVPLSQEQRDYAAEQGVELETVPVAMEGFVFVVNAENPVDTLTQAQLRDIYSGKITNWSQVGGLDEEIIPYQRNKDSGSQNYMTRFMGDTPLMDAPTEMRPASMSGLMDVIAINDNARGAIGYSVYAYAADMYGNGNEIKFIQVDGVAPSKATMAAGEYPLMGENLAIFNAREPEDSYVRQLVDWILSYDGQLALAQAGYVTMENIGFDYEEMTLSKYQGTGTGPVAQGTQPYIYTLYTVTREDWGDVFDELVTARTFTMSDGKRSFRIEGLTNEKVLAEVHQFIDEQIQQWAWEEAKVIAPIAEKHMPTYDGFSGGVLYDYYLQEDSGGLPLGVKFTCDNGYFSVVVLVGYDNYSVGGICYVRVETATWDLLSGDRLELEELFCRGVDIDQTLNQFLLENTQVSTNEFSWQDTPYNSKRDFAGLTTTGWHMTHDTIYFDQSNPYFAFGAEIFLDALPEETMTAQIARDFTDQIAGNGLQCRQDIRFIATELQYEYSKDGALSYGLLTEDTTPHAEEINRELVKYVETYYTREAIRGYFEKLEYDPDSVDMYWLDFSFMNMGGRYGVYNNSLPYYYYWDDRTNTDTFIYYPHDSCLIFDLESGQRLSWQDLLLPGWEDHCVFEDGEPEEGVSLDSLTLCNLMTDYGGENLCIYFSDGENRFSVLVPFSHVAL